MVEHDHFVGTCIYRLELGEHALDVVERFDLMARSVDHVASQGGDNGGYTFLPGFLAMGREYRFGHDYDGGLGAASRVQSKVSAATGDYEPYVRVSQIVSSKRFDDSVHDLLFGQRNVDPDDA